MGKASQLPQAPSNLREGTRNWFANVVSDYDLEEHQFMILICACEAWDRKEEAREAIDKHGLVYYDRFGSPKERPEVATERDNRLAFLRCVRELGLPVGEPEAPRVPRVHGGK